MNSNIKFVFKFDLIEYQNKETKNLEVIYKIKNINEGFTAITMQAR